MKYTRNILFLIMFVMLLTLMNPVQTSAWGDISVSISTTNYVETDHQYTVTATASTTATSMLIKKGGTTVKSCSSCTVLQYTYTTTDDYTDYPLSFSATAIKEVGGFLTGYDTDSTNVNILTDFVYKDGIDELEAFTEDTVYDYATTNYPGDFSGSVNTAVEKIKAIHHWAKDVLADNWASDSDAKTAIEVLNDYEANSATEFDCRDMASFIAGMGYSVGLSVRIVSLSDVDDTPFIQDYQHFFAELYGLTTNGNNGWFLIDPARDSSGSYYSSYTSTSTVATGYGGPNDSVTRLWISSGFTNGDWGTGIDPAATGWMYQYYSPDPSPPSYSSYSSNPWGI